ncbi:hypothetical protein Clacol_005162 [Clathrus columnatus]|uniref:Peptidase M20 dimerisation domain-containing protein n=1 Tax=Clathrus columnatus TaxID=1419009 RepID=A0AAV5AE38_9AGAM|nr:hypothetical protein Clacol_005162 [Clathrus columnatus]
MSLGKYVFLELQARTCADILILVVLTRALIAEEGGGGKLILIERGGYKDMDVCLMAHPGTGNPRTAGSGSCRAIQKLTVEYEGHPAHASAAPWEGQNALDAAFIAYGSIAALRQQIKPTYRIHGIVEGRDWAANIIPDYAKMTWIVRAPTAKETEVFTKRVVKCLEYVFMRAVYSGNNQKEFLERLHSQQRQKPQLNTKPFIREFTDVAAKRYGIDVSPEIEGAIGGSTDFQVPHYVGVIYIRFDFFKALPSIHPSYAIPTQPNGGNHTAQFTASARTKEAHDITFTITKILALNGFRVLDDELFCKEVHVSFEETMKIMRDAPL